MVVAAASAAQIALQLLVAGGVNVRAAADVVPCPAPDEVSRFVAHQLGVRGDMSGWTIRYAPAGTTTLAVEVTDGGGRVRAQRRIVTVGGDRTACRAAAQTIAAIGVRAFHPIDSSIDSSIGAAPAAAGSPATANVVETSVVDRRRDAGGYPRFTLAVGPALVTAPALHANVFVDIGARLVPSVGVHAGGFLLPMHHEETAGLGGRARLTRVQTYAAVTWAGEARGLGIEAGPALGVGLDRATTANVTAPGAGRRAAFSAGVLAAATWPVAARWRVGAVAALWAGLPANNFAVTTEDREMTVFRSLALSGFTALRVEGAFFP